MQKRNLFIALFLAVVFLLLSELGAHVAEAKPTFSYAAEEKRIYLTFDDGPSTVVTNRILDTLKEEGVKATFFIVSDRAETRKETLLRIAQEGHSIGVHSKSHDYGVIYQSTQSFLEDVRACAQFIRRVTGKAPTVYRFPGGRRSEEFSSLVKDEGLRIVSWNACCRDEEIANATAEQILQESVKSAKGKRNVVLLCHDSATHATTAEALPMLIAHFRQEGYAFCAF